MANGRNNNESAGGGPASAANGSANSANGAADADGADESVGRWLRDARLRASYEDLSSSADGASSAAEAAAATALYFAPAHSVSPAAPTLPTVVLSALCAADTEHHRELMRNVLLVGGGALGPKVAEILESQLRDGAMACAPSHPTVAANAHRIGVMVGTAHDRRCGVWVGGSILGSMGTDEQMWMSRAEFAEHGAAMMAKKGLHCAL